MNNIISPISFAGKATRCQQIPVENLKRYIMEGKNIHQIAETTNTSPSWVYRCLKQSGLSTMASQHKEEKIKKIIEKKEQKGYSDKEIAQILDSSVKFVRKVLAEHAKNKETQEIGDPILYKALKKLNISYNDVKDQLK